MDSSDKNYNTFIAQSLNLDKGLDFLNDNQALHEAESEIHKRGLDEYYLQALNEIDSSRLIRESLDDFKTKKSGFRALAVIRLLKKVNNS